MRERASVLRLIYVKQKAPDSQKVLRKIKLNTTLQNTAKINVFRPGWMSRRKKVWFIVRSYGFGFSGNMISFK